MRSFDEYQNIYRINAYFFPEAFPKHLLFPRFWQNFDGQLNKLLDKSEVVSLMVSDSSDKKGYVMDIATGIYIPIVSYQHYTDRDYILTQKDRLEHSMDSKISFCVFDSLEEREEVSKEEVEKYIREKHTSTHYNLILQYANSNQYVQNPNKGKKPMSTVVLQEEVNNVANNVRFVNLTTKIQGMITELSIDKQAAFYTRLASILEDYGKISSELHSALLDITLSTYVARLSELQEDIWDTYQQDQSVYEYSSFDFLEFLKGISTEKDTLTRMTLLYQEMNHLSQIPLTSSLEDQLLIVDQFLEEAISNFCFLSLENREKFWQALDSIYQKQFISKLEMDVYSEDVLQGRKFQSRVFEENKFSYFNQLLDKKVNQSSYKNAVK